MILRVFECPVCGKNSTVDSYRDENWNLCYVCECGFEGPEGKFFHCFSGYKEYESYKRNKIMPPRHKDTEKDILSPCLGVSVANKEKLNQRSYS